MSATVIFGVDFKKANPKSDRAFWLGPEETIAVTAPTEQPDTAQFVTLGDKTVMVSQMATDEEIAAALGLNNQSNQSDVPVPLTSATPLPPAPTIQQTPTVAPVRKPTGSFAASLRAMMDEARASLEQARNDGTTQVKKAVEKLTVAKESVGKVSGQLAKTISDEADDVMAELGQISNDL